MRISNPSLPSLLLLSSAIGLLATAGALAADPVYKWKDSSGQSHYSQSPPEGQKYETITPAGGSSTESAAWASSSTPIPTSTRSSARTALEQKNCDTARSNAALLAGHPSANLDTKGTGKPAPVSSAERTAAIAHANQQVIQFCGK